MLEIRDLVKVYRPKKGVPVTAIDHISLRLPEQGMVFLLGKSGSGKSTLLNLLGGLDSYDSGDILIRNESSRGFKQAQFDSYRNAYVGFIFQEYNVLEEFTVGANIALAIELQGKKATDEQINAILQEVDLAGYGGRRPNELSGGQKQRVAIARALVKEPKIIMADEPTGALDSQTGRQIFDTLKKLSAHRLVLVVSHDRDFAEQYADRIVELADGRVISDQTYTAEDAPAEKLVYNGDTVTVAPGYHLTEEDRLAINAYLDTLAEGGAITGRRNRKKAVPTDNSLIPQPTGGLTLVRSKLPLRSAFKIGASSLRHKRFRLVVTILLSCIAFGLFGLSDTFGAYNHIQACTDSLVDSGVDYASVAEQRREYDYDGNPYYTGGYSISDEEIAAIQQETGIRMKGVFVPKGWTMDFYQHLSPQFEESENASLYTTSFSGFSDITATELMELDYKLVAGTLPRGDKNEIALSAYVADMFVDVDYMDTDGTNEGTPVFIDRREQMVGKTVMLGGVPFTVTGVIDTRFDLARYAPLTEDAENLSAAEEVIRYALQKELDYAQRNSLHAVAFTGEGYVKRHVEAAYPVQPLKNTYLVFEDTDWNLIVDPYYIGTLADIRDTRVLWLDGKSRTTLSEKELVVSLDLAESALVNAGLSLPDDSWTEEELAATLAQAYETIGPLREESQRRWEDVNHVENGDAYSGYTVVGVLDPASQDRGLSATLLTSPALKKATVEEDSGYYSFAVGPMPTEKSEVKRLVSFAYREEAVRYVLRNAVTYELDMIHEVLVMLADVFFWIGVGFALFAALMLANFISVSISYKRQEIGILRAIGSRSNDVFRIFFAESFVIAMINFVLSAIGVGAATALINYVIRHEANILLTVLHFGLRQIVLLLAVSLFVAAVASFFPVRRIAAKRPIDAIRGR